MRRSALVLAAFLALAAAPALAHTRKPQTVKLKVGLIHHCHRHRHRHRWSRCHGAKPKAHRPSHHKTHAVVKATPPPADPTPTATPTPAPVVEIGDVPGCRTGSSPLSYLAQYQAVLRVIINPGNYQAGVIACAQQAAAAGYRVHLVIQWWNPWTIAQVQSFYRTILDQLGGIAWAVSIGNEQELTSGGPGITGPQYATVWQAVEPIVAAQAPQAIRVAGEISPWGFHHLQAAYAAGLPGVQAVSGHPYNMSGCFSLPAFLSWANSIGLPAWFDEGYSLPGVWLPAKARTDSEVAGAAVVGAWLVGNPGT